MDLSRLSTLKKKMEEATDFQKVWEYFLDNFGEVEGFAGLGEPTRDSILEEIIIQTGKQILHKEVKLSNLLLIRIPEHRFIHGACMLNAKFVNVIYFEESRQGMFCMLMSGPFGETRMSRFSAATVQDPRNAARN